MKSSMTIREWKKKIKEEYVPRRLPAGEPVRHEVRWSKEVDLTKLRPEWRDMNA